MIDSSPSVETQPTIRSKEKRIEVYEGQIANGLGTTKTVAEIICLKYFRFNEQSSGDQEMADRLRKNSSYTRAVAAYEQGEYIWYCRETAKDLKELARAHKSRGEDQSEKIKLVASDNWDKIANEISEDPNKFDQEIKASYKAASEGFSKS